MSIRSDMRKIADTLRKDGVRKLLGDTMLALQVRGQKRFERNFDRRHGVMTEGITFLSELTVVGENKDLGSEYVPSPGRLIDHAISKLPSNRRDYTFVDYGAGKGRIVMRAASQDFKRVVGIEFASELFDICSDNIAAFRAGNPAVSPIELIHADAQDFEVPDGPCVFFFYNPFLMPVMEEVLRKIAASYRVSPRPLYFVHLALRDESGNDAAANVELIGRQDFIDRCRYPIRLRDIWTCLMFSGFKLDMFQTVVPPIRFAEQVTAVRRDGSSVGQGRDLPEARMVGRR